MHLFTGYHFELSMRTVMMMTVIMMMMMMMW